MNYRTIEEIEKSDLPYSQKMAAILKFKSQLLTSNKTGEDTTQALIKKQMDKNFAETQVYGVKALNSRLNAIVLAEQEKPKEQKIKTINPQVPNYTTVGADRQISGIANDFISRYLVSGGDFDKAWKFYKLEAPKIKGDPYYNGLENTIKKTMATIKKRYGRDTDPFEGYKYSGNIGSKEGLPMTLNAMYNQTKTKAIIFTGRENREKDLAASANKIFSVYKDLETVQYMTTQGLMKFDKPKGSETLRAPSSDYTTANSMREKVLKFKLDNGGGNFNAALDASVNGYNEHAAKVDRINTRQIENMLGIAVGSSGALNSDTRVNKILDMKVREFKNYGSQFAGFQSLAGWTSKDDVTVRDLVSTSAGLSAQKKGEQDIAEHTGALRRTALNNAYSLAKELGIPRSEVSRETISHMMGVNKTQKQKIAKGRAFDNSVGSINAYLQDSKLQMDTLYSGTDLSVKFPKRNEFLALYAKKPNQAVHKILDNINNPETLRQMGLLEENTLNPILNLKGKVQVPFVRHLAQNLLNRSDAGRFPITQMDDGFLTLLANNLQGNTGEIFTETMRTRYKPRTKDDPRVLSRKVDKKMSAVDYLGDFGDIIKSKRSELAEHNKFYDSAALDYANSLAPEVGEGFYLDSSKKTISSLKGLQDSDKHRADQGIIDNLVAEGFDGDNLENLKARVEKERAALPPSSRQNLNQSLFDSEDGELSMFRNAKTKWKEGLMDVDDYRLLTKAHSSYFQNKDVTPQEMFKALAGVEFDYLGGGEYDERGMPKNVYVRASNYLKSAVTYGAGEDMIEDMVKLGFLDKKDIPKGFKGTAPKATIDYQKMMGSNKPILVKGSDAHDEIYSGLQDYLDPKNHTGKVSPGYQMVYNKFKRGNASITAHDRIMFNSIKADQKARADYEILKNQGKVSDNFKSSIDRDILIRSLAASQGFGGAQFSSVKPSLVDSVPKLNSLTEAQAANFNRSRVSLDYTQNKKFHSYANNEVLRSKGQELFSADSLDSYRERLKFTLDELDGSDLDGLTKRRVRAVGEELYYRLDKSASEKSPMNTLAFKDSINSYKRDVGLMSQRRSKDDSESIKESRYKLDNRFGRYGVETEGNIAVDKYYLPAIKHRLASVAAWSDIPSGTKPFAAGDSLTSEQGTKYRVEADKQLSSKYGTVSFGDSDPKSHLDSRYLKLFGNQSRTNSNYELEAESLAGVRTRVTNNTTKPAVKPLNLTEAQRIEMAELAELERINQRKKLAQQKRQNPRSDYFWPKIPMRLSNGAKIPGDGHKDEVPALLTKGETVLDKQTSKDLGIHSQGDYLRFKKAVKDKKVKYYAQGQYLQDLEGNWSNAFNSQRASKNKVRSWLQSVGANPYEFETKTSKSVTDLDVGTIVEPLPRQFDTKNIDYSQKVQEARNKSEARADSTNKADLAGARRKLNENLRGMKLGSIDTANLQGKLDAKTMTNSETKKIFAATQVGLDPEMSINDHISSGSILNSDQGNALQGLASNDVDKAKLKNLTETAHAKTINKIASGSLESLIKDLDGKGTTANYLGSLKNPGNIVDPALALQHQKAKTLMAKALYPDMDKLTSEGADTFGGYSKESQESIRKLQADPEKYENFKQVAPNSVLKSFGLDTSMTKLDKTINTFKNNMEDFNTIFKTDLQAPKNQQDLMKMVKEVSKNSSGLDISRKLGSSTDMKLAETYLKELAGSVDTEAKGGQKKKIKLDEMSNQIGQARSLKDNSKMRWSGFSDLMTQNAAFGASYAVIGGATAAIANGVGFVTGLDERLHNLQAITGATGNELNQMSKSVKLVSTETKFSANEIADAATVLGQAGFSAQDIKESLGGVVKLATATGSQLEDATQTLTSALTIWDAPMRDSTKYADEFTAAINQSKLDIKSLSLALQYTGNIAAQGGVPVEDVLTITSLMKDAGIKQGSTVGTGQRLVYSDILAPSAKFQKSLASVGVSKKELSGSFEEGGIIQALKLMRDSGYGFGQATSGMEVRERSAYMAMVNQLDKAELFRSNIMVPGAADAANETQMKSFNNRLKNMVNSWGIGLDEMMNSKTSVMGNLFDKLTYSPDNQEDHPFDLSNQSVLQQMQDPKKTFGMGDGLGIAIGAGALGYAGYRMKNEGMFRSDKAKYPGSKSQGTPKVRDSLGKTAKNFGKSMKVPGILGGLYLGSSMALSDEPAWATGLKEGAPLLAGTALAGGTALLTRGATAKDPLANAALMTAGAEAWNSTVGDTWNKFIDGLAGTDQPTQMELLENVNTRYAAAASSKSDIAKYRQQIQKQNNNPFRYADDATESEKSISRIATRNRGIAFNEQFEAEKKLVKKKTGKSIDFSDITFDTEIAEVDQLDSKLKDLSSSLSSISAEVAQSFLDDFDKLEVAKLTEKDDNMTKATNKLSGKYRGILSNMAVNAPEQIGVNYEKIMALADNITTKLEKFSYKDPTGVDPDGKLSPAMLRTSTAEKAAEAKAVKANNKVMKEGAKQAYLTSYASTNNAAGTLGVIKSLKGAAERTTKKLNAGGSLADGDITQQDIDQNEPKMKKRYLAQKKSESGYDAWSAKYSGFVSDVTKINDSFKKFYKTTMEEGGKSIIALGREFGQGNIAAAIKLSNNFDQTGTLNKHVGEGIITNKPAGYQSWMGTSPTAEKSKSRSKIFANHTKTDFKSQLSQYDSVGASMQLAAIKGAYKSVEKLKLPNSSENIQDPYMYRAYQQRDLKLQGIGFKPEMMKTIANLDLMSVNLNDALSDGGVLSNSEGLLGNMNDIWKKQQEAAIAFKTLDINRQKDKAINQLTGEGTTKENWYTPETSKQGKTQAKRQESYDRALEGETRNNSEQMKRAVINFGRQVEKLEDNTAFQAETLAINYQNQTAAMGRKYRFQVDMAHIQNNYKVEDATTNKNYQVEGLNLKRDRSTEDLNTNIARKLDDLRTSYDRQIKALNLGFNRQIESIERSRQDTLDFFDRSMTKPTNITLNPESFAKIAVAMNDNTLAIDAHKASLAMNTNAITQLVGIQTTKEDIVKEAYKYAYKGVGGEVYSEDGEVNQDFTEMYESYLARNNESLLDTVLDQAVGSTFAGSGFNVNQALTDSSYMADSVLNPDAPVTTQALSEGSGYGIDELINALLGTGTGEVRVTTTQGVVLEAQGDLAGAIFDLETQMMKYDIQLREGGVAFQNSLTDAGTNLTYSLEDLNLAFTRGMDDIDLSHKRGLEDIETSYNRALEQIALSFSRNLDMMALNHQFQLSEAAINFQQALAALARQTAFNKEQMAKSLQDLFEDLAMNADFKLSEAALDNEYNREQINKQFASMVANIDLSSEASIAGLNVSFNNALKKVHVDATIMAAMFEKGLKTATAEKRLNMSATIANIQASLNKDAAEFNWEFKGLIASVTSGFKKLYTDPTYEAMWTSMGVDSATKFTLAVKNALGSTLKEQQVDLDKSLTKIYTDSLTYRTDEQVKAAKLAEEKLKSTTDKTNLVFKGALNLVDFGSQTTGAALTSLSAIQTAQANLAVETSKRMALALQTVRNYLSQLDSVGVPALSGGTPTNKASTGAVIPGYGGGDILPFMLEPGEAVVRKEAVKALGRDYFEGLNNPTASSVITRPSELSVGLISSPLNEVNSNKIHNDISVGISITADVTVESIEANMSQIADGVKRVFEEYI